MHRDATFLSILMLCIWLLMGCTSTNNLSPLSDSDKMKLKQLRCTLYNDLFEAEYRASFDYKRKQIEEQRKWEVRKLKEDLSFWQSKLEFWQTDIKAFKAALSEKQKNSAPVLEYITADEAKISECRKKIAELQSKLADYRLPAKGVVEAESKLKAQLDSLNRVYREKRNDILKKYGLPPNTCYLHHLPLTLMDASIWGGLVFPPPDHHTDEMGEEKDISKHPSVLSFPYDGEVGVNMGCTATQRVKTIRIEFCPECKKASDKWFKQRAAELEKAAESGK